MKVTRIGPSFQLLTASTLGSGGTISPAVGSSLVPISNGSNGWAWGSNVSRITAGGSNVLGPFVNFAAGSNVTLTIDQVGAIASNTIRIHATSGAASFGSNSNAVSYANAPGASTDSSRADHVHMGVTSLAHSSNTFTGPVILTASGSVGITSPTPGTYNLSSSGGSGGGGSGALVLLEQYTASASATLNFTTCITSTYDDYVIEIVNLIPATDGAIVYLRCSTDGGSTYDSAANYHYNNQRFSYYGGGGMDTSSAGTEMRINGQGGGGAGVGNAAAKGGLSGTYRLFGPLSTTAYKFLRGQTIQMFSGEDNLAAADVAGVYHSTTAVNAFRVLMSSGNITSGTIRVYGLTK